MRATAKEAKATRRNIWNFIQRGHSHIEAARKYGKSVAYGLQVKKVAEKFGAAALGDAFSGHLRKDILNLSPAKSRTTKKTDPLTVVIGNFLNDLVRVIVKSSVASAMKELKAGRPLAGLAHG